MAFCAECGREFEGEPRYCAECGHRVAGPAAQAAPAFQADVGQHPDPGAGPAWKPLPETFGEVPPASPPLQIQEKSTSTWIVVLAVIGGFVVAGWGLGFLADTSDSYTTRQAISEGKTVDISGAGGSWADGFTLNRPAQIDYSVLVRDGSTVAVCLLEEAELAFFQNGQTAECYASDSSIKSTTRSVTLGTGTYYLGIRCLNILLDCTVSYDIYATPR